jgi:hypothetical protein
MPKEININIDVENLHKVKEYIERLTIELKYYKSIVEKSQPLMIIDKN